MMFFLVCILFSFVAATPLDDYVNMPDPTYSYKLHSTYRVEEDGYTVYVINMTSQTWLTPLESDSSVWTHWLSICVPDTLRATRDTWGALWIGSGDKGDPAPTSLDPLTEYICVNSRVVSASLTNIPNQPVVFADDPEYERYEDAYIAYTWAKFLNNTAQPFWLARLPMTKAVVRAMDTVQDFVRKNLTIPCMRKFFVSGASKRGWTTWTTAAVDSRVGAIAPLVIPILNIVPNMNWHYRAFGGWSFVLEDYLEMGIMNYLNQPVFQQLAAIVEPYSYRHRLRMPKLIINAAGDQFFLPDSAQFFYHNLIGEKFLNVVPNIEHSMTGRIEYVASTVNTFFKMVSTRQRRPEYNYRITKSNSTGVIELWTLPNAAVNATLYFANTLSTTLRDFRLTVCWELPQCYNPVFWSAVPLSATRPGYYRATMDAPANGWTGFLVELSFQVGDDVFTVTSDVNVVPDRMPFPPCGLNCQ